MPRIRRGEKTDKLLVKRRKLYEQKKRKNNELTHLHFSLLINIAE